MFSLGLFSNKKESSTHALWRIDDKSVSVTIVADDRQQVLFFAEQTLRPTVFKTGESLDTITEHLRSTITGLISKVKKDISVFPKRATVIVGEPWSHVVFRTVIHERPTSFRITKTIVSDLIARDIKNIDRSVNGYDKKIHTHFSEPTTHQIYINGHKSKDYYGKSTTNIRIEYATGFFDALLIKSIVHTIHEQTRVPLVQIHTKHYQDVIVRFWNRIGLSHGVVVDPTGAITDLYGFQHGRLIHWGTIPVGASSLEQNSAHGLGVSHPELDTLFRLYDKKLIDQKTEQRINNVLGKIAPLWIRPFQDFCAEMVQQGMIIDQVVWMGEQSHPIEQFLFTTVTDDQATFPMIFGSTHTECAHIADIIESITPGFLRDTGIRQQDAMVVFDYYL